MNFKIVKFLLLATLLCSAIFAVTMIFTHPQPHQINSTTKPYECDPVGGGYPNILECGGGGDGVGGGHPP
jgi:hypothetical protein